VTTQKITARINEQTLTAHLHDKTHRRHLFTATAICLLEICLIMSVEAIMIHLMVAIVLYGRDAAEALLSE
jgi:hypothetical protein